MIIQKTTYGAVIQRFDTETRKFIGQEFIPDCDSVWEDENCEALPEGKENELIYGFGGVDEPKHHFNMIQP